MLEPEVREAALLLGAFQLLAEWAEMLIAEDSDPGNAMARFRLTVLAAELATYFSDALDMPERLEGVRRTSLSMELSLQDMNTWTLAQAKCCHLHGDIDGEERALEAYAPDPSGNAEYGFRTISFALKAGRSELLPQTRSAVFGGGASLADRISVANIVGDRGRWLLREGKDKEAYSVMAQAFLMARMTFHRRGLFVKATTLADIALRLGEGQIAAEWWAIGDQFSSAGHNLEMAQGEPLRRRIARVAGNRAFSTVTATADSLRRIIPDTAYTEANGSVGRGETLLPGGC